MNKIYEKYEDLHVRKTYIYVKANDAYAYADSGKTVKIAATTLNDLFLKGAVIVSGGVEYAPTSFALSVAGVGTITYVTADATTATTAVLAVLYSEEYTAPTGD